MYDDDNVRCNEPNIHTGKTMNKFFCEYYSFLKKTRTFLVLFYSRDRFRTFKMHSLTSSTVTYWIYVRTYFKRFKTSEKTSA